MLISVLAVAGGCTATKNTATGVGQMTKSGAEAAAEAVKDSPKNTNDMAISTAVKGKLADDELVHARAIDVDTDGGVVYLKGKQDSEAAKTRAEQLARQTDGVKAVVNEIVVSR
jgi:osmotically-inducible protein OsmY